MTEYEDFYQKMIEFESDPDNRDNKKAFARYRTAHYSKDVLALQEAIAQRNNKKHLDRILQLSEIYYNSGSKQ
ncbi:hypothetical protein ACVTW2_000655 [Escherichia coli]